MQNRAQYLSGLLNGIDTEIWNPAKDDALARRFDARSLNRKAENRAAISERFDLSADSKGPLFCVISRLTEQKGLDALLGAVPHLVERGAQLVVLGSGAPELEEGFRAAAAQYPGNVGVFIGYDEPLSHLLQGGSDAILIPSRFEPCGLTQLYGLRYGTLPVVARTGGLADTVIDANVAAFQAGVATGFMIDAVNYEAIEVAIGRVITAYSDTKLWRGMQRAAMRHDVDWAGSAGAYVALYESLAG